MEINKEWLINMTRELKLKHIDETMNHLEANPYLFTKEDWDKIYEAYISYLKWEFNEDENEDTQDYPNYVESEEDENLDN